MKDNTQSGITLVKPVTPVTTDKLLQLQLGGYLQYLDAEHIAIKPICRLLGLDHKDTIEYLLSKDRFAPRYKLFTYSYFIHETTYGVEQSSLVIWLLAKLTDIDRYDRLYALLLCLQIMANGRINTTPYQLQKIVDDICRYSMLTNEAFIFSVAQYLADVAPMCSTAALQNTKEQCYADVT